jgi:hypothetical protein
MKRVEPSFGYYYYPDENKVESMDKISHYGLFSTFTLLLSTITLIHRDYKVLPEVFDLSNAMMKFKTDKSQDLYKILFKIDKTIEIPNISPVGPDPHHTIYTEDRIKGLYPYIKRFFGFSDELIDIKNNLLKKYNLVEKDYISVIYRGSDQFTDRGGFISVNCSAYEKLARELISEIPVQERNILIQSEEYRVLKYFGVQLGAKFIRETDIGEIGKNDAPVPNTGVDEWLKNYIAAIFIHSQSNTLITYTGNSGFWATLFRGSMNEVYQESTFTLNREIFFNKN